jgi:DNA-binding transcriptional ArsR family regulator
MARAQLLPRQLRDAAPLFAALGDQTRIGLLLRLSTRGAESITQLSAGAAQTRQAITKHLLVLEGAGLVRGQRRGREHIWQLQPRRIDEAQARLEYISRQWDDALARLKDFVEE